MTDLKKRNMQVRMAAPTEGYRAWYGGMSISRHVKGRTLDAAYDYLNWWISGWPGAVMACQGYYISTPELTALTYPLRSGTFGMTANLPQEPSGPRWHR
ncbi:hypothetical protein [Vreelandella sedimenti]|nr:hypothetical protein [Halomonas sedimenti]|tara:strand:+ start:7884 stop:8180 length:297 start_codon:yes stop_codon:yes gene_type:complete